MVITKSERGQQNGKNAELFLCNSHEYLTQEVVEGKNSKALEGPVGIFGVGGREEKARSESTL